jgi:hypothetical protein
MPNAYVLEAASDALRAWRLRRALRVVGASWRPWTAEDERVVLCAWWPLLRTEAIVDGAMLSERPAIAASVSSGKRRRRKRRA